MNNLGLLYLEHGFIEDALPYLAKAVEMKENVAAFHNNLGMALEHMGRFVGRGRSLQGRVDRGPRATRRRSRTCPRRSREERSGGAVRPCRGGAGYDEDRKVASDDTREAN